jgi:hypothetical protein
MEWLNIWETYNQIKISYNVTSTDILKQLSLYPNYKYIKLLTIKIVDFNYNKYKSFINILDKNKSNTNWIQSATYEEKLIELQMLRPLSFYARVYEKHNNDYYLNITMDDQILKELFTIDNVVPHIKNIYITHHK